MYMLIFQKIISFVKKICFNAIALHPNFVVEQQTLDCPIPIQVQSLHGFVDAKPTWLTESHDPLDLQAGALCRGGLAHLLLLLGRLLQKSLAAHAILILKCDRLERDLPR